MVVRLRNHTRSDTISIRWTYLTIWSKIRLTVPDRRLMETSPDFGPVSRLQACRRKDPGWTDITKYWSPTTNSSHRRRATRHWFLKVVLKVAIWERPSKLATQSTTSSSKMTTTQVGSVSGTFSVSRTLERTKSTDLISSILWKMTRPIITASGRSSIPRERLRSTQWAGREKDSIFLTTKALVKRRIQTLEAGQVES